MRTQALNDIVDKSGKSRQYIACKMGLTRMQLYRLLSNPRRMRIEQMILLSEVLGRSPRYMIGLIKNI